MKLNLSPFCYLTGLITIVVPILGIVFHKYDLIMIPMSWPDAQNYCREKFTDLATIHSDTDLLRFTKEAESKALTSPAWVGLYNDVDGWRWSFTDLPLKNVPFTNWASGQPNNYPGNQPCGQLGQYNQWWDLACKWTYPFICYDVNFTGADRFIGISTPMNWTKAQTYCRTHHTDLASSLNSSDDNILVQIKIIQGNSWFGLYRDTWKWSDGTKVSDLTWAPEQPDNSGRYENCATVYNGKFSDERCTEKHYFFCQTLFPKMGQIVRVKVKSSGSVLNPAVHLSMLEKIQKKLEEKGLFNITMSSRVQPNGNIFYKEKKEKN